MSEHYFNEVRECVEKYFALSFKQNLSIQEITQTFRENPLPSDLMDCGYPPRELRRHGQLLATKYLIQEHSHQSAQLPEYDLVR